MNRREYDYLRHNLPEDWQDQFIAPPNGRKVVCRVCGASGYHGEQSAPMPWQITCLLGHPERCERCGQRFLKGMLAGHKSRVPECASKPTQRWWRLQQLLAEGY